MQKEEEETACLFAGLFCQLRIIVDLQLLCSYTSHRESFSSSLYLIFQAVFCPANISVLVKECAFKTDCPVVPTYCIA